LNNTPYTEFIKNKMAMHGGTASQR